MLCLYTAIIQAHCWSRVHDTSAVDILGDSNDEASQIAMFSVDSNQQKSHKGNIDKP